MTDRKFNRIAGEWLAGESEIENRNPSDLSDAIGLYAQASGDRLAVALGGAFGGSGQKCTASSRLVVHEAIHDDFVEKLVAGARAMKVGHALEEGTQIGPVVSAAQLQGNLDYIAAGQPA